MHTEKWIWKSALPHYINKLEQNDIYPFILKKLQDLTDPKERDFVIEFVDKEQFVANYDHLAEYAGLTKSSHGVYVYISHTKEQFLPS